MSPRLNLTYPTALVLQALARGFHHGFDIMDATGLPSGTVYPILRRLDREGYLKSAWESQAAAQREQRPARRYYEITGAGEAMLVEAVGRFRALDQAGLPASSQAFTRVTKSTRRDPLVVRICLALVGAVAIVVPGAARGEWRAEWEAEIRHRWQTLDRDAHLDWRTRMNLFRRALGALPDAAWLRRQFTEDADVVHDVKHGARMLLKSPSFALSAVADSGDWHWRHGFDRSVARHAPVQAAGLSGRRARRHALAAAGRASRRTRGCIARGFSGLARPGAVVFGDGRGDSVFDGLHRRHGAGGVVRGAGHRRVLRRHRHGTGDRPRVPAR